MYFELSQILIIEYKILLAHIRAHGSWYIGKIDKKSTWYASSWNLYTAISETYTYIYIYLYTNVIYVSGYIPVHTEFIVEKVVIRFGTSFI